MSLEKLAPVGGRATSGRDRWWLEGFAEVCQDLPDRPRLRAERHQPDVTACDGLHLQLELAPGWIRPQLRH